MCLEIVGFFFNSRNTLIILLYSIFYFGGAMESRSTLWKNSVLFKVKEKAVSLKRLFQKV